MEHAQREMEKLEVTSKVVSLNPYFNGTCSKSFLNIMKQVSTMNVLILILMEHAQREEPAECISVAEVHES